MQNRLLFLLRYIIFWLVFFIAAKLIFLVFNPVNSFPYFKLWPAIIYHGIKLDLSTIGYLLFIPGILMVVNCLLPGKWYYSIIAIYTYFFFGLFSLLFAIDIPLYKEWGFRLDTTPLMYLKNPNEAMASTPIWEAILYISLAIAITFISVFFYKKIIHPIKIKNLKRSYIGSVLFLFLTASLIVPIRGGFDTAPINTGSVYFHSEPFINHAALNLPWNVLYSITKLKEQKNPFKYYKQVDVKKTIDEYKYSGTIFPNVLNTNRPNILLIIVESLTSKASALLSNDKYDALPNFDRISKEGLLFTNMYASSDRSNRALVALLSGFPAQSTTAIILYPEKTEKLPGLPKSLRKAGYDTKFYYGGDINFSSIKSYLKNIGYQDIISKDDFKPSLRTTKWGVPDEYLFDRLMADIESDKTTKPYFKTIFTLSSHPPFDVPGYDTVNSTEKEPLFLNSLKYTDKHLGKFIDQLNEKQLLKNTLVVIVGDHGYGQPGNSSFSSKEKFMIPMLWLGGALDTVGKIENIASQADFATTLLSQLNLEDSAYIFSRNILASDFANNAYYAFPYGFGYVSDDTYYNFLIENEKTYIHKQIPQKTINDLQGKLFYQVLYEYCGDL